MVSLAGAVQLTTDRLGHSSINLPPESPPVDTDDESPLLSLAHIDSIALKLDHDPLPDPQEAVALAKQLVQHVRAQQKTKEQDNLNAQAAHALSADREHLQQERWQLELAQLQAQARVLARKLVQQARPAPPPPPPQNAFNHPYYVAGAAATAGRSFSPPLDYGYHLHNQVEPGSAVEGEIELDNRRLRADVRLLKTRLRDSEGQTSRLEAELRRLRSHLLHGTPLVATDVEVVLPPTPSDPSSAAPHPSSSPPPPPHKHRVPLMGDAEAEHLLLAGKSLSHIRRINRVPLSAAIALQAHEILNASASVRVHPSSGRLDDDEYEGGGGTATPKPPKHRKPPAPARSPPPSPVKAPVTTPRRIAKPATTMTTTTGVVKTPSSSSTIRPRTESSHGGGASGGTPAPFFGMEDLLQAAQTVLVPGGPPPPPPASPPSTTETSTSTTTTASGSPKRRRLSGPSQLPPWIPTSSAGLHQFRDDASTSSSLLPPDKNPTGGGGGLFSALDVLAEASSRESGSESSPVHSSAIVDRPTNSHSNDGGGPSSVPGRLGAGFLAYVPEGGSAGTEEGFGPGAKRVRSPYVKWTVAEDELLVQAVILHAQRWDLVASAVPTRTYHQCRQRWLRGLKSGDALPEELVPLRNTVKKVVREFEVQRMRNKEEKGLGTRVSDLEDDMDDSGGGGGGGGAETT